MGRHREPLAEKLLKGSANTTRERMYAARDAAIRRGVPAKIPPPAPKLTAAERETWLELRDDFQESGLYRESNRMAFRAMVQASVVVDAVRDNPRAWLSALGVLTKLLFEFGGSPMSRAKMAEAAKQGGSVIAAARVAAPRAPSVEPSEMFKPLPPLAS